MNSKLLLFLLISSIILFSSCKKNLIGYKSPKISDVNVSEIDFHYLQTKTKVNYAEGEKQVNGIANIRICKDSLIWISLSPAVGIEASRIMINRDTALVINRLDKEFYIFNFEEISRYFNFKIDFNLIQAILLGNLAVPLDENSKVAKDGNYFLVKQKSGPLDLQTFILLDNRKIETMLINEAETSNFLTLKYSDFKELNEYLFGKVCQMNLTYKAKKGPLVTSVNLQHNKAEISDKPLKFPFNVPEKYEVFK